MIRAVLQVPAYREPEMLPVLRAWGNQPTPEGITVDRQVWVTLSPPERELCTTWQAALEARGFEVHEAPEGKLAARNAAHNAAVESEYDVIAVADADAPPLRSDSLAQLLAPFRDEDTAAVAGRPKAAGVPGLSALVDLGQRVGTEAGLHLPGQFSAFTATAWDEAGPFDTSRSQTDLAAVRQEEEFDFRDRVAQHGVVETAPKAVVRNDMRRWKDKLNRAFDRFGHYPRDDWIEQREGVSFAPRDE